MSVTVTEITGASSCPSPSLPDVPAPSTHRPSLLCITSPWTVSSNDTSYQYNKTFTMTWTFWKLYLKNKCHCQSNYRTFYSIFLSLFNVYGKYFLIWDLCIIVIWISLIWNFIQFSTYRFKMIESNEIFLSNQKWSISPTARVCNYLVDRSTCKLFGFCLFSKFSDSCLFLKFLALYGIYPITLQVKGGNSIPSLPSNVTYYTQTIVENQSITKKCTVKHIYSKCQGQPILIYF